MLGFNSPREPIKGDFAKDIRNSLRRAVAGKQTAKEEKLRFQLKATENEWSAVWK